MVSCTSVLSNRHPRKYCTPRLCCPTANRHPRKYSPRHLHEGELCMCVQRGIEDHVHHGILIYCDKTRTKPLPVRGQFLKQPDLQASAGSPNSPQTALRLSPGSSDSSPNSLNPAPKLHSLTPAFRVYVDFVPKLLNSPEASLPKPLSRQPGRPRVGVCLPEDLRDDFYRFRI